MYEIGSQVFENWTIARKIGAGSFGAVYEIQRQDFGETYRAAAALDEYEEAFPKDHMSHALRGMLLITIENGKAPEERDYSQAFGEYWEAEGLLTSSDDRTYFLQLQSLIDQLKENGWL